MITKRIKSGWPPHAFKKFIKAVLKIHYAFRKQGINLVPYMDKYLPMFEMSCRGNKSSFAGLVIYYYEKEDVYEVFEYQAGPNNNELWIYGYYKSPMAALKKFIKSDLIKQPVKIY